MSLPPPHRCNDQGREEKRSEPDPGSQYGVWNHLLCEQMSPYALGAVRGMEVSKT